MSARSQALSHEREPLSVRSALGVLLVLMFLFIAKGPALEIWEQRQRVQRLEAQAARIAAENEQLRQDMARLRDPAVLEQLARECLGMIRPGEQAVVRAGDAADC